MNLLLDTHTVLWAVSDPERLGSAGRTAILDQGNRLFVSLASLWEMAIKVSLGKLRLAPGWEADLEDEMRTLGCSWLPLTQVHCLGVISLPFHHRDPFDRLLIAQAMAEDMAIVTRDEAFSDYDVTCIW